MPMQPPTGHPPYHSIGLQGGACSLKFGGGPYNNMQVQGGLCIHTGKVPMVHGPMVHGLGPGFPHAFFAPLHQSSDRGEQVQQARTW